MNGAGRAVPMRLAVLFSLMILVSYGCAGSGKMNACGGTGDLVAMPGQSCGVCGVYTCDGSDAVKCEDPGANQCGGCAQLEHSVGERCGECGMYECLNEDAVHCVESPNECGGCTKLEGKPGDPCGDCGKWICNGSDDVNCDDPGFNDCGGCEVLPYAPGDSCGQCGTYVCSGTDAIRCEDPGLNGCGGCAQLPGGPGDSCGTCGEGEYTCDGSDAVTCEDPDGTFSSAVNLGHFTDSDNNAGEFYGTLSPGEDETDWYMAQVDDEWNANMEPWFRITNPTGRTYVMCAYFDSDAMDGCLSGTSDSYNGLSGCCGDSIEFDVGGVGSNSGGWVYIRITYDGQSAGTCDQYHVTFGF